MNKNKVIETLPYIGATTEPTQVNHVIDYPTITTIAIAVVGGWCSLIMWINSQLEALKTNQAVNKATCDLLTERLNTISSKVTMLEGEITLLEKGLDQRVDVLEEQELTLFNAVLSIYKQVSMDTAKIDDLQAFLENAILTCVSDVGEGTVKRSYRRGSVSAKQDKLEEVRQFITAYTAAKSSHSSNTY